LVIKKKCNAVKQNKCIELAESRNLKWVAFSLIREGTILVAEPSHDIFSNACSSSAYILDKNKH
jgi:hypothetical protein